MMERKKILASIENSKGLDKVHKILDYSRFLNKIEPKESYNQAKIAYRMAKELNDKNSIVSSMIHLAYGCLMLGNYLDAEKWAQRVLKKSKEENIVHSIGTANTVLGNIYHRQAKYAEALQCYLNALGIYQEIDDKAELCGCYTNLGTVHLILLEFGEALNYFQLAKEIAEERNLPIIAAINVNIANILFNQGKYNEVLIAYKEAAAQFEQQEMLYNRNTALYNIGLTYAQLNAHDLAQEYFQKVYSQFREYNDCVSLCRVSEAIATEYIKTGELDEVPKYLEEALSLARDNNLIWDMREIYHTYSEYYKATGDCNKGMEYLNKEMEILEDYYQKNHNGTLAELEAKYKTKIYMEHSSELQEKNKIMTDQLEELKNSLELLRHVHENLQKDFENNVNRLNTQDSVLASQARMSVMGEMISAIAHQWRQPLNVISVLTQSIGDAWEFNELNEEFISNQIELILEQVHYMSQTITDFRDFFKEKYLKAFRVSDVIRSAFKIVSYQLKINNINTILNLDQDCELSGNPSELTQVIVNIINNARQEMIENNIQKPEIRTDLACSDNFVKIEIFNTGNHIKSDNLKRIFEPYFTTREEEGTGIGLYICKMIIENKFQGNITAKNYENGVLFTITAKKTAK